jgi:hypothetical protein
MLLKDKGVNVAVGVEDEYDVRNLRFDIAWVSPLGWMSLWILILFSFLCSSQSKPTND